MRRGIGRVTVGAIVAAAAATVTVAAPAVAAPATDDGHVQLVALDGIGEYNGTPWTAVVDETGTVAQFADEASARAAAATFETRAAGAGFELWAEDGSTCLTVGTNSGNTRGYLVGRSAAFCSAAGASELRISRGDQLVAVTNFGPALTIGTPTWSGSAVVLSAETDQVVPFRFVGLGA